MHRAAIAMATHRQLFASSKRLLPRVAHSVHCPLLVCPLSSNPIHPLLPIFLSSSPFVVTGLASQPLPLKLCRFRLRTASHSPPPHPPTRRRRPRLRGRLLAPVSNLGLDPLVRRRQASEEEDLPSVAQRTTETRVSFSYARSGASGSAWLACHKGRRMPWQQSRGLSLSST